MKKLLGLLMLAAVPLVPARASEPVPDFKLADVNPNSVRRNVKVSPRDYLLQVSGFYFGMAH